MRALAQTRVKSGGIYRQSTKASICSALEAGGTEAFRGAFPQDCPGSGVERHIITPATARAALEPLAAGRASLLPNVAHQAALCAGFRGGP